MAAAAATSRADRRWTAEERREAIVEAALEQFAAAGLAGASTEAIARRAGISHAYLFRLFGTKRDLFLAAVERSFDHVLDTFRAAAEERGEEPLFPSLGRAYQRLIAERKELLFQFHAYAACGDEDICRVVERRYMEIFRYIERTAGVDRDRARLFMATGLLISVGSAIGNDELSPDGSWSGRVSGVVP